MVENSIIEKSYCTYCRNLLNIVYEIKQEYHDSCYSEIKNFDSNDAGLYFYLDSIKAGFDDISCDIHGNIVYIDLSNKGMTHIPDLEFSNIKIFNYLEEINLSRNYLRRIPNWIFNLPKLKKAIFPGNGFSNSLLFDMIRLNSLGIEITSTGCIFNKKNKLISLNISFIGPHDPINLSDEIVNHFSDLEIVILRYNHLTNIPYWVTQLKKLTELNLATNSLARSINDAQLSSKKLEILNLAGNNLKSIPNWIFNQSKLKELNLANNPLSEISNEIFRLKRLKKIILTKSFISQKLAYLMSKLENKGIEIEFSNYNQDIFWWADN